MVRPGPPRTLAWVESRSADAWTQAPDCLELQGELHQRTIRIPVTLTVHGEVPAGVVTGLAQWIVYEGASGAVAFMLRQQGTCLLWHGSWQAAGALLRLAAGEASLRT